MTEYKPLHRLIRGTAGLAVDSFFTELRVIGGENVPKSGPIVVYVLLLVSLLCSLNVASSCATHHNMMLDPVILCKRPLSDDARVLIFAGNSGWVPPPPYTQLLEQRCVWHFAYHVAHNTDITMPASLFGNPIVRWILLSSGNIPVDRKSKDRRVLLRGTIEALAKGEAVALFPEGTSYTEPRIMQVKDGAAWAALEYTKWAKENPDKAAEQDIQVIPAAIVYTNKTKYRSCVSRFSCVMYPLHSTRWVSGDYGVSSDSLLEPIEA